MKQLKPLTSLLSIFILCSFIQIEANERLQYESFWTWTCLNTKKRVSKKYQRAEDNINKVISDYNSRSPHHKFDLKVKVSSRPKVADSFFQKVEQKLLTASMSRKYNISVTTEGQSYCSESIKTRDIPVIGRASSDEELEILTNLGVKIIPQSFEVPRIKNGRTNIRLVHGEMWKIPAC